MVYAYSAGAGGGFGPCCCVGLGLIGHLFPLGIPPARVFFRRLTDTALEVAALRQQTLGERPPTRHRRCVGLSRSCCGNSGPSRPKRSSLGIQTPSSGIARVSAFMGVAGPGGPGRPRISEAIRVLMRRHIEFHLTASYGRSRSDTDRVDVGRNSLLPIAPNEGTLTGP